jgi:hypothetical protein
VRIRPLVSLVLLAAVAGTLPAQNSPQMSPAAAIPEWRTFLGANPLGIPFDIVSIEGETALGVASTIGFVGSYNDIDSKRFTTIDGRFKYYPAEVAMRGFSVGMSVGWTKFRGGETFTFDPVTGMSTSNGFQNLNAGTLGVLIDYNWTQGPAQRFVIGTGIGAKRILAAPEKREPLGLERAYPTARFVIGLLF